MDLARFWPVPVAVVIVAGCASVLGIPSDAPSFCVRPENQGHDYCEDFDVGNALARVGPNTVNQNGATTSIEPSDASPPNLIDFLAHATAADAGHEVAGYYKTFGDKKFVGLHIEADMKFVTHGVGTIAQAAGFMLIGSSPGACLGLAAVPWPLDAGLPMGTPVFTGVYVPQATGGCASLVALGAGGAPLGIAAPDAGAEGGGFALPPIVPVIDNWFHLTVQIAPSPSGDGSGVLLLRANLAAEELALPMGTVPATGLPIVGFASAPAGSNGPEEVQIDNVTVDVAPQQLPPP